MILQADNYGGLSQLRLQQAAQQQAAIENAFQTMLRQRVLQREQALRERTAQDYTAQQAFANQFAQAQADRQWSEHAIDRTGLENYRNRSLANAEAKAKEDANTPPAAILNNDYKAANDLADTGQFGSEEEVLSMFPNLNKVPGGAMSIVQRSMQARPLIVAQINKEREGADQITGANRFQRSLAPITQQGLPEDNSFMAGPISYVSRRLGNWAGGGTPDTSWERDAQAESAGYQRKLEPLYTGEGAIIGRDPISGDAVTSPVPEWANQSVAPRRFMPPNQAAQTPPAIADGVQINLGNGRTVLSPRKNVMAVLARYPSAIVIGGAGGGAGMGTNLPPAALSGQNLSRFGLLPQPAY